MLHIYDKVLQGIKQQSVIHRSVTLLKQDTDILRHEVLSKGGGDWGGVSLSCHLGTLQNIFLN